MNRSMLQVITEGPPRLVTSLERSSTLGGVPTFTVTMQVLVQEGITETVPKTPVMHASLISILMQTPETHDI